MRWKARWRTPSGHAAAKRRSRTRRVAAVLAILVVNGALLCWAGYEHGSLPTKDGEGEETEWIKIKEAVDQIRNSPAFRQFLTFIGNAWQRAQTDGWRSGWSFVTEELDPTGEATACETLGVARGASSARCGIAQRLELSGNRVLTDAENQAPC